MAKESAQLRQDVTLLQEKNEALLTVVKGAKAEIEISVGDMHELAYELTKLKHAHNLDCWRLNELEKQNERLVHQLIEVRFSLFCDQYIICISFIYFFFRYVGKRNSTKFK
jgi:chitinase